MTQKKCVDILESKKCLDLLETKKCLVLLKGNKCLKCNSYRSTSKDQFYKHSLTCYLRAPINKTSYKCKLCEKSYAHELSLDIHLKVGHLDQEEQVCQMCHKNVPKIRMKSHREQCLVKEFFKCPICPATFTTDDKLRRHVTWIHTTEKSVKCDKCGGNFENKQALSRHINEGKNFVDLVFKFSLFQRSSKNF